MAVHLRLPGALGLRDFGRTSLPPPIGGSPAAMADTLRAFAAEGIGHVQLVIDPVTPAGVEALAPVLEALDR
ncbi:hypothetical protein BH23CHL8_BH23CHL8_29290 [soil metagenome]